MIAGFAAAATPATLWAGECTVLPAGASASPRLTEVSAAANGESLIVSGRVTRDDCTPLAGALVEVWSSSAEAGASATTDADGRFLLTTTAGAAPLQVRVSHGGHTLQTQRRLTTADDRDAVAAHVQRDDGGVWRTTLGLVLA
jgi:protocatechuate 3,4-dioxygenase beta subunit